MNKAQFLMITGAANTSGKSLCYFSQKHFCNLISDAIPKKRDQEQAK
jgi:hypothetical protein